MNLNFCLLISAITPSLHAFLSPAERQLKLRQRRGSFTQRTPISITALGSSNDFIDSILNPPDDDSPSYKCSHMIAVPLEQNHDLLLDIESVQRGILYHCPLLIGACVAPVVMRMPLLMVDTENSKVTTDDLFGSRKSSPGNPDDLLTSRDPITQEIHEIVNSVVDEMIYVRASPEKGFDEDEREGVNLDSVEPVMMKFKGLELDGDQNDILHAAGTEECTTPILRNVLDKIRSRIEAKGWKVYLPIDDPQGRKGGLDEDGETWRPRIPFMRLPSDFYQTLPDPKGNDGNWANYSDEMKDSYIRDPEEGGNGISPIFFYKWWDDKLCNGNAVRIRELAVYGRTGPMGVSEQAFYIPHLRTKLPDGNEQLHEEEEQEKNYDDKRRNEQGIKMDNDSFDQYDGSQSVEMEIANLKSSADRRMLEAVYQLSPDQAEEVGTVADSIKEEMIDEIGLDQSTQPLAAIVGEDNKEKGDQNAQAMTDIVEEEIRETAASAGEVDKRTDIISSIAKPMATGNWPAKKNKPKPEDNPILKNWKARNTMAAENADTSMKKIMPPFPSDEHFIGIWRLISSPGGPMLDEEDMLEAMTGDPSSSENLILRIDGSTAGGPILDVENQHRAAGGNWKFFQAEWCGEGRNDKDKKPLLQTRMRVRLVIPPSKDKVLVMEGEVKRGTLTSAESVSLDNANELRASSSFGMNRVVNKPQSNAMNNVNDGDPFMYVTGEAWVEDAVEGDSRNGRNRTKLGRFSLMKRKDRDPSQYQYSIPAPQRYQD